MRALGERNCGGCRYWSEMIGRAGGGTTNTRGDTEALCLAPSGVAKGTYTTAADYCGEFAKNTHGAVDHPENGEEAMFLYETESKTTYPNGKPRFAKDGTMLDEHGNRSSMTSPTRREPNQLRAVEPPTEVAVALATNPSNVRAYTATTAEAAMIAAVIYQLPKPEEKK